jgi:hypothetical protein
MVPFDSASVVRELAKSGLTLAVGQWIKQREQEGFQIMLEEFRSGETHPCTVDPVSFAGMVYRYNRFTCEGVARVNLRIIARLIAGISSSEDLIVDEFTHYSNTIAALRREELVFLVRLHLAEIATTNEDNSTMAAWEKFGNDSTERPFSAVDSVQSLALSITRTGFIVGIGAYDGVWGKSYNLSRLGKRIIQLAAFEAALEKEPVSPRSRPK